MLEATNGHTVSDLIPQDLVLALFQLSKRTKDTSLILMKV